jgi:hypothetical protein
VSGRNRNRPCWCGSGQKYKRCHLGREHQTPPSPWDHAAKARKLYATKLCLHPTAGANSCSGPIVRAHTVRRSADLKAIARNGHVYQSSADFSDLNRTDGRVIPKLIGINDASTFWGFCKKHDATTFASLENRSFVPTDEQRSCWHTDRWQRNSISRNGSWRCSV